MYIEFTLPQGASGQVAVYVNGVLNKELHSWSDQYSIPYNKKNHKYTVRITFDNEEHYSFFALTWAPKAEFFTNYITNYRLIEPMRRG